MVSLRFILLAAAVIVVVARRSVALYNQTFHKKDPRSPWQKYFHGLRGTERQATETPRHREL